MNTQTPYLNKQPKTFHLTHRFSVIELVLTLVVVIVGSVGIVGMLSLGIESDKQALGTSHAVDAGEQFLRFNAGKIKSDWSWRNTFANTKPGNDESTLIWGQEAIFNVGAVRFKSTSDFTPREDNNSGFFLLEQTTNGQVDFSAVLRVWKDSDVDAIDLSEKANLYVEVSWPASVPYASDGRQKQLFRSEVFKEPEISLVAASYDNCTVAKPHGGGFTTTINSVTKDDSENYLIQLKVDYDGCTDTDCLQLERYGVESDDSYEIVEITGDGTAGVSSGAANSGSTSFKGFKFDFPHGMGGNGSGSTFCITYTVESLQDQQIEVMTATTSTMTSFLTAEFDYVYTCSENTNDSSEDNEEPEFNCPDVVEFNSIRSLNKGKIELQFGCDAIKVRSTRKSKKIKKIRFRNQAGKYAQVNVSRHNIYTQWQTIDIPEKAKPIKDVKVQVQSSGWSQWQQTDALCNSWGDTPPTFPNDTITLGYDVYKDNYFCYGIGSSNMPTDPDSSKLTWTISDGPSWLSWNDDYQQVVGTPPESGTFNWTLTTSDGCWSDSTELTIVVYCQKNNKHEPVWPNERFTFDSHTIAKNKYFCWGLGSNLASDGDGIKRVKFNVCDGPEWLSFTSSNQIAGTPPKEGTYTWMLCADDGCHQATTEMTIDVVCGSPNPPVWPKKKFTFNSHTIVKNKYFCWGLGSNLATDVDGNKDVKFTVCDGPDWAYFNSSNQISGTPPKEGTFTLTLCADDGCHVATAEMTLTVVSGASRSPRFPSQPSPRPSRWLSWFF